jgi:hypothetical protein
MENYIVKYTGIVSVYEKMKAKAFDIIVDGKNIGTVYKLNTGCPFMDNLEFKEDIQQLLSENG